MNHFFFRFLCSTSLVDLDFRRSSPSVPTTREETMRMREQFGTKAYMRELLSCEYMINMLVKSFEL
jgi:hypothetical protein